MKAVIYFDKPYVKWSHIYLESLRLFEPNIKVVVYLFNTKKQIMYQLYDHPNVIDVKMRKMRYMSELGTRWRFQLVCRKGGLLLEVMDEYPDEDMFMLTDVDLLFRRNLLVARQRMIYNDIGFVMSKSKPYGKQHNIFKNKVMSGLIFVKNNKRARAYMEEYHKNASAGRAHKQKEQLELARLHDKYKRADKCKFLLLDYDKYLDPFSKSNSWIWSPHKSLLGSKDNRFKGFQRELKKLKKQCKN